LLADIAHFKKQQPSYTADYMQYRLSINFISCITRNYIIYFLVFQDNIYFFVLNIKINLQMI